MVYKFLIDPLLNGLHRRVVSLIEPGQRVLDVACGHGTMALMTGLEKGCEVTGIDLEASKIAEARKAAAKKGLDNLRFLVMDATDLSPFGEKSFDVAVTSMAIHQFSPALGLQVLKEMKRVAHTVIVADYAWPLPGNLYGRLAKVIEWIAGGEHYRNFKLYQRNRGLDTLLEQAGLQGAERYRQGKGTMEVSLCVPK